MVVIVASLENMRKGKKNKFLAMALTDPFSGLTIGMDLECFLQALSGRKDEFKGYRLIEAKTAKSEVSLVPFLQMKFEKI